LPVFEPDAVALVVGVHGIAQQRKGEDVLRSEWEPPLRDGLRRSPRGAEALRLLGRQGFACAFYGDLFRAPGRALSVGDPFITPEDLVEADAELLMAWWRAAAETDEDVVGPDARGLGVPGLVQAGLRALSASRFFAGLSERALMFDLVQVRRYFNEPEIRAAARARVEEAIGPQTRVVVGHSLGSVVAYEVLCAHPEWQVESFVTLGSPLGIRHLIYDRLDTPPVSATAPASGRGNWPACVRRWTNIADAGDVVALVKDLEPLFGPGPAPESFSGYLVDNGARAHAVSPYLTTEQAGMAIGAGLLGEGRSQA